MMLCYQPSAFDRDLHIMDAEERKEARLSRRREPERRIRALESAEEREARLARRRRERGLGAEFTYVRPRTYTFVRPHMCGQEQNPQSRSGSPHNACISLVLIETWNIYGINCEITSFA